MALKWTQESDDKYDKSHGIKENSAKDKKLDAERGLKSSSSKSKKRVSASQANKVATFLSKRNGSSPALPTPADNPVSTDDDNVQSQGA